MISGKCDHFEDDSYHIGLKGSGQFKAFFVGKVLGWM